MINSILSNKNIEYVLSGRTAIDFAIRDIKSKKKINKALLPSYICESMILPFINNNIPFDFYKVDYQNGEFIIDYEKIKSCQNSIILLCDYFVPNGNSYKKVSSLIDDSSYLIHDITHTIFSNVNLNNDDYTVCSLRKWFNIPDGGIVISNNLYNITCENQNLKYINYKLKSKELRDIYNNNPTFENRKKYKYYYNIADKILNEDYSEYKMSDISINNLSNLDINNYLKKKKELLIKIKKLLLERKYYIPFDNSMFTISILVSNQDRNTLINEFYELGIRCTIFWDYNEYNKQYKNYFVDNSISFDISENTLSKLKRYKERRIR